MGKKTFLILLALSAIVYVFNLVSDVMEVDAAQYAAMSWEMFASKKILQVHCGTLDYLDKPPLLFWLSTASFYIFGISNFSHKLPSLLFVLLGIYSTYRFAKLYYTQQTAFVAALMLATTQAVFLITNDVRTDTILTGAVIFAIWQLAAYIETSKASNLFWGGVGIGLAMLAKGPIGLIAVGAALLPHILLQKKWKTIFDWRIIIPIAAIALLLLPMCIGLYQQWGSKGLRFYFWTQSFGRITGESEWSNNPDTFFLVHSTAWAFLPWTLFLFVGWISTIIELVKSKFKLGASEEIISISGFTLVLIALMLSKYQLPHYIFIVYPLGAVMAARYFLKVIESQKTKKWAWILQNIAFVGLLAVSCFLQYAFKGADVFSLVLLIITYAACIFITVKYKNLLLASATFIIAFNFLLSAIYLPAIMRYQPTNDFGRYINQYIAPDNNFVTFQYVVDFSTIFYAHTMASSMIWDKEDLRTALEQKKKLIIITNSLGIDLLDLGNINYRIIEQRQAYKIARINFKFLNPATRDEVCTPVYLVEAAL